MEIELPPDFKEFLRLLNSKEVKYLLIGGFAVGYHGYPRATNDLDIWVAVDLENAKKIVATLKDFGFQQTDLSEELFLKQDHIIRMGVAPIRIEILTSVSGIEFDDSYRERVMDHIDGIPVQIIGLKQLRVNKQASGRHKDLDDLENLP